MEVIGTVERVSYARKGFAVFDVKTDSGRVLKAVGHAPSETVFKGARVRLWGSFQRTQYGWDFLFERCFLEGDLFSNGSSDSTSDEKAFIFLSRVVKGLGEKKARELIDKFGGERIFQILENEPEVLLSIKGIKEKRLARIVESYRKARCMYQLSSLLQTAGIGVNRIVSIYNEFGPDAPRLIKENPYVLTEVRGIGYKTADRIARNMGYEPSLAARIASAVVYVLKKESNDSGHTYLTYDELFKKCADELRINSDDGSGSVYELSQSDFERGLQYLEERDDIKRFSDGLISLSWLYTEESFLLHDFKKRASTQVFKPFTPAEVERFIERYEREKGVKLSDEQRKAVETAAGGRGVFALSGYAGTGKTTVSKLILDILSKRFGRDKIICCALSGVAADRIRNVTGYTAKTVHSLLGWQGADFRYNRRNPLPFKVVLLDEASMVNTDIMFRLVSAVSPDAVFVMVGDPAQLPPIGPGDVFSTIVKNDVVPHVSLQRVFRQSEDSVIKVFANSIRKGQVPPDYRKTGYRDFLFCNMSIPGFFRKKKELKKAEMRAEREKNASRILSFIENTVVAWKNRGLIKDWIRDFQVISPMRKGTLGTDNLNFLIRDILNPLPEDRKAFLSFCGRGGQEFRLGDKVIHLKNKDMLCADVDAFRQFISLSPDERFFSRAKGVHRERICNGMIGRICAVDQENERFYVLYPQGGNDMVVEYIFSEAGDILELGYAITVHKMQGSQVKRVIMPIVSSHYIMLDAKLLYTAFTRAEEYLLIVGHDWMFRSACRRLKETKRRTVFERLLNEVLNKNREKSSLYQFRQNREGERLFL